MKVNGTFAAILIGFLATGANVSAIAAPVSTEIIKENEVQKTETVKEKNSKSDKNGKPSEKGSQGSKCAVPYPCW